MRKVRIGAIQLCEWPMEQRCNPFADDYAASVPYIMEHHVKKQVDLTLARLDEAGANRLDIVTTGEDMGVMGAYIADVSENNIFPELAEAAAAYAEEQVAAKAREYGMYVVACYYKRYPDAVYNVASLFDRTGQIVWEYRKTHLPPNEMWQMKAGNALTVFDTDFGRIGVLICYDMMFPEAAHVLALQGVEIVFHPTAGYGWYDAIGEATLRTRANDGSMYIVTAKNHIHNSAGHSSVIDHWGLVLADAGFYPNRLVWAEIDLDITKTQPDWYIPTAMSGEPAIAKRTLIERRPDLYGLLPDETLAPMLTAPPLPRQLELRDMLKNNTIHW